ncbi:ribosome maturation factor RimP [Desulfitispora alkaliphila]|uniref:ribosome maturation factor RimP n=1 Tax=Desulfitispora alkaliphila TaxID=622674 RepID=UPI003D1C5FF4
MSKVAEQVEQLINPLFESDAKLSEYELVDVEYKKEGENWFLRVYIDKDDGINLDDCQKVSSALDVLLDEHDVVPNSYFLEVSSPGIERPLKKPSDFEKFIGKKAKIKGYVAIYDKQKEVIGVIADTTDTDVTIHIENNIEVTIKYDQIASAHLWVDF